MPTVVLAPTEDQVFDALWGWITGLFDVSLAGQIFKGFQNITSTPLQSYIVISPGVAVRQNQIRKTYDNIAGTVANQRNTTYSYQVDCYGPNGPDWSNIISIAWRTMTAADALVGLPITPLYADEPNQLNIVNGENVYEQRFMLRLYAQVNQTVTQPQDFFTNPVPLVVEVPADLLPP